MGNDMSQSEQKVIESFSHYTQVLLSGGKVKEIPLRRSTTGSAFIDQITFSFHQSSVFYIESNQFGLSKEDVQLLKTSEEVKNDSFIQYLVEELQTTVESNCIKLLSKELEDIFGFGITQKNDFKGRLFYQETYHLGDVNCKYGTVHIGGQNETIAVELTAQGCTAAKPGWEERLHYFLNQCFRPKITRIDLAHDFLNGEYTADQAVEDFDNGGFSWTNRKPKSECRGTDWRSHDNSGKTFYIGSRYSSKYTRFYEKGKQLGDKTSSWLRAEVEFRAHDQVIPLDILLCPSEYLCGAYPIFQRLFEHRKTSRIETVKKQIVITEERAVDFIKKQLGRYINYFKNIKCLTDEEFIDLVKPAHCLLPERLNPLLYQHFKGLQAA